MPNFRCNHYWADYVYSPESRCKCANRTAITDAPSGHCKDPSTEACFSVAAGEGRPERLALDVCCKLQS